MKTLLIATAIAVSGWGFAPGAQAQSSAIVNSVMPDDMIGYVEQRGDTVKEAQTLISGSIVPVVMAEREQDGVTYYLYGNACNDEDNSCLGLKFFMKFNANDAVTLEKINKINMQAPAIKIWSDGSTVGLERYLILDKGMTEANIAYELQTFLTIVPKVLDQFK